MSEIVPASPDIYDPAPNPAVLRCIQAYNMAIKAREEQGHRLSLSTSTADRAYRNAMPPLSGIENIRDFIACVAQGMLIGSIGGAEGARLLYAAQVASVVQDRPIPGKPGRPPASPLPNN